jgi:hypothetical protein
VRGSGDGAEAEVLNGGKDKTPDIAEDEDVKIHEEDEKKEIVLNGEVEQEREKSVGPFTVVTIQECFDCSSRNRQT